jgi:folate-binding protein YgfZ
MRIEIRYRQSPTQTNGRYNASMATSLLNPLRSLHAQAEAEFQAYGDLDIVSTFGEPPAEYAAIHKGCGMIDLPQRGILELTGKDRLPFLNNLLTNQVWKKDTKSGLETGEGVYAFFLNTKGRIVTDLNVIERGDRTLLEMDARMVAPLQAMLEKYQFTEQVELVDRSDTLHQIALHGPLAAEILSRINGAAMDPLTPLSSTKFRAFDIELEVYRDDPTGQPGYVMILPTSEAKRVWMQLLSTFGTSTDTRKRMLRAVGWAVFNACRIEGGRPVFGIDFDDSILPAETGQFNRAVSVTKGCYLGQEIVARMHARQQVAKQLVGIRMESDALPMAGTKILDEASNEIGGVTSSTLSPVLSNTAICLAYLKRPFFAPKTVVNIPAEGSIRKGTVVELPFVMP